MIYGIDKRCIAALVVRDNVIIMYLIFNAFIFFLLNIRQGDNMVLVGWFVV